MNATAGAVCVGVLAVGFASGCKPAGGGNDGGPKPEEDAGQDGGSSLATLRLEDDSPSATLKLDVSDGGKVELYFPKNSVREDVEVRVEPLAQVSLPTGTVVAGVNLLPDGQVLHNTALLTLSVPGTLDPKTTLGFSVHAGKVSYHPVVVRHKDRGGGPVSEVDIPLLGFSGHGIVSNSDPAVVEAAIAVTDPPLDQLEARLATARDKPTATMLLANFYRQEVDPKLQAAAALPELPDHLEVAMRLAVAWRNMVDIASDLFGIDANAGIDETAIRDALTNAILSNINYWNNKCGMTKSPADAKLAVNSWLWAVALFLDSRPPLEMSDLLSKLCLKIDVLGADLDAILETGVTKALVLRAGLKVQTEPTRFDTPLRVRLKQVLGGSVAGAPTETDAMGKASMTATASSDPAVEAVITATPKGWGGVPTETIVVYRPRNGGEPQLLSGRSFAGTQREVYVYAPAGGADCASPPTTGPCAAMSECPVTSVHRGVSLVVAGTPSTYTIQYTDKLYEPPQGSPAPPAWVWTYQGSGSFGSAGGVAIGLYDGMTTYDFVKNPRPGMALPRMSISMNPDTGKLLGDITYPCHRITLDMQAQ